MTKGQRLAIPPQGGRLSKRYAWSPGSWAESVRRDLNVVALWLMAHSVTEAFGYQGKVHSIDGVHAGFRYGSQLLMLVAGVTCDCLFLPHRAQCPVWRKMELREHMWSCYGMTASTGSPPVGYSQDVVQFPRAG